jgi:hypothetical protein
MSGAQPLGDESPMPFGKYKGRKIKSVPASYLDWLHGQDWIQEWPRVLAYIEANRTVIDEELRERGKI